MALRLFPASHSSLESLRPSQNRSNVAQSQDVIMHKNDRDRPKLIVASKPWWKTSKKWSFPVRTRIPDLTAIIPGQLSSPGQPFWLGLHGSIAPASFWIFCTASMTNSVRGPTSSTNQSGPVVVTLLKSSMFPNRGVVCHTHHHIWLWAKGELNSKLGISKKVKLGLGPRAWVCIAWVGFFFFLFSARKKFKFNIYLKVNFIADNGSQQYRW